jgi:hypothetical protein
MTSNPGSRPPDNSTFALGKLMWRAMRTSYGMIARESIAGLETAASVEAVIELLVQKRIVEPDELAVARDQAMERIAGARAESWDGPSLTMVDEADEGAPAAIVDCASRLPHCRAACCAFYSVALTETEVRKGEPLWDLGAPYQLPRTPAGYCVYLDQDTYTCTVWNTRPYVCRRYDCSQDTAIWQDFESFVPAERVRVLSRRMQQRISRGGTDERDR